MTVEPHLLQLSSLDEGLGATSQVGKEFFTPSLSLSLSFSPYLTVIAASHGK